MKFILAIVLSSFCLTTFAQDWQDKYNSFLQTFETGDFPKSIEEGEIVLKEAAEKFGKLDTNYCNTLYYLQYAYFYNQDYQNATDKAREEVKLREQIHPEDSPKFITSAYNFALFATYTKDYSESMHYMKKVYDFYKSNYGTQEDFTITITNQFASIANMGGSFGLAKQLYDELFESVSKKYSNADSTFQATSNTVSSFYYQHGHYDKCEPFFLNALAYQEQAAGKQSEVYLLTLNSTGEFYLNAGMLNKAEKIFKEQIEVTEKFYGKKSADYATAMNNLAVVYENLDRLEEADELYQKAIKLKAKIFKKESNFYALTVLNYGILKYRMGDMEESEELLTEAMNIYKTIYSEQSDEYIRSITQIAQIWQNNGEYEKAEKILNESLSELKSKYGEKNTYYVNILGILARNYTENGRNKEALELYKKILEIRAEFQGKNHIEYAGTLRSLGQLYQNLGNNTEAEKVLLEALKIQQDQLEEMHTDIISTYSVLAWVYMAKGNIELAENYFDKCISLAEQAYGSMHPDFLAYLNNYAYFLAEIGDLEAANKVFKEALQKGILAYGKDGFDLQYIYSNMGNLYAKMGNFKKAEESQLKSIEIIKKTRGEDNANYASALNSMGVLYYNLGNYKKAEKYYAEALPIYKKAYGDQHPDYAATCSNIGSLYMQMGINPEFQSDKELYLNQSQKFFDKVLQIDSATIGTKNLDFAIHLNNIAELNRFKNQPETAEKYFKEVIALEKELLGPSNLNSVSSLNNFAMLMVGMQKIDEATKYAEESLKMFYEIRGENSNIIPNSLTTLSYTYAQKGEYQKASKLHQQILEKKMSIVQDNFSFLSEEEKAQYLEDFVGDRNNFFEFLRSSNYNSEEMGILAYNVSLFEKGLLMKSTQKIRESIEETKNPELIAKMDHWFGLKQELAKMYTQTDADEKIIEDLESNCNQLEKELVMASSELSGALAKISDWNSVSDQLSEGEIAIEFIEFESSFYVGENTPYYSLVMLKPNEKPQYINLFKGEELENILGKVAGNDVQYINGIYGNTNEKNNQLFKLIWSFADTLLQNGNTVYFAPSGLLNKVSHAALYDEKGNYLSDRFTLIQLNSTSQIQHKKKDLKKNWDIALFGGANFSVNNTEQEVWKYLEGTKREVHNIGHLLDESNFKVRENIGPNATEENLKEQVANESPSILHIATHGFFYPDPLLLAATTETESEDVSFRGGSRGHESFVKNRNPLMRSGIVLTGANNVWNEQKDSLELENIIEQEDGVITAFEISTMDLSNTELAVLSACETGLGDIKGSEGVYGLQRAFKIAGVNYLIMSLWQVPDRETEEFMTLFYKNLVKEKNIRKSFLKAQETMRGKYDPYYWGAFVLVE